MSRAKVSTLRKPVLSGADVLSFAEKRGGGTAESAGAKSGLVPQGDVRLTANIRGDLIEQWVDGWH